MAEETVHEELTRARATIARQAEEIRQLQQRGVDAQFADNLRAVLVQAAVAGTIAAPVSHSRLLEMIVETAARVITSRAAALFLLDLQTQELVFEVALGQKADAVKKFRIPLGHGIAGLVAASGQPTATSGAADPRQAADIAQSVGYVPNTILCVPLFYAERVIGVLELLDKADDASYTMTDMQVLALFANLAAVAIEQSRTRANLAGTIAETIQHGSSGISESERRQLLAGASRVAAIGAGDSGYQQALAIARLVEEISRSGDRELAFCQAILSEFATYLHSRPRPMDAMLDLGLRPL
jgi:GAF domain-containing protein